MFRVISDKIFFLDEKISNVCCYVYRLLLMSPRDVVRIHVVKMISCL